jgi:excisionase family DNA binding protein
MAPGLDRLISKQEAADIWGVSVRTLEREINSGRITKQKVRGCVRLRFSQVLHLAGLNLNPQES